MLAIIEHKWWILLIAETIAWLATFYMGFARYWLQSNFQFVISGAIAIITGYVPHIFLAILDYMDKGEFHFFGVFILLLLILGVTVFKKYAIKLDTLIKEWACKRQLSLEKSKE